MSAVNFRDLTSIDEVDALLLNEQPPEEATSWVTPFEKRFLGISPTLKRVLFAKYLFKTNPAVERQFRERREIHAHSASVPVYLHLKAFERTFSYISYLHDNCFSGNRIQHFLDLGCSPGGFSNFLMKANRGARGSGITLPDEGARFPMPRELDVFGSRYCLRYDNIITLVMRSVEQDVNPVIELHADVEEGVSHPYDLIVAGAFPTMEGHIPWHLRAQLVLSQLLIIFTNIAPGGASVFAINTKAFLWLVDMLGLLHHCFESVTTCKGQKLHAVRTSCYLVCRGFRASEDDLRLYTGRLRNVLKLLDGMSRESRADGGAVNTILGVDIGRVYIGKAEELPLVFADSVDHLCEMGIDRFAMELFEPMWRSQCEAIRAEFIKVFDKQLLINDKDTGDSAETPGDSSSPGVWRPRRRSVAAAADSPTGVADESAPDTPPPSPYVPKWRPPQRRMSTVADFGRSNTQDWRTPAASELECPVAFGPLPPTLKVERYGDPFFRKRSQSNADTASKWRKN